ncbi:hypothetical protein [Aeromonas media]|uniref:hypothetical protein n=1 Tax=Aeromonas media TaxID=651 RepID=UPI00384F80C1
MGVDDYLKVVDAKIFAIDEIAKLESELKKWLKEEAESIQKAEEIRGALYEQINMEIKNAIVEICQLKNILIYENKNILRLSYKEMLGFTINLSEKTRFISRTENGNVDLSFSLKYDIPSMQAKTSSIISYSSEKERLELQINRCKDNINHYDSLVDSVNLNDVTIQLELKNDKVIKVNDINEIISIMFS